MNKKANCNNCGQKIEFDASMANSLIACPSCGVETKLTEADLSEPKTTEKTTHKAEEKVASGAHIRVGGQKSGDSPKTPRKTNIIPPKVANKIDARFDARFGNSRNVRQAGWVMTVFGSVTFATNFLQFLDFTFSRRGSDIGLSESTIRADDCFTHCALGLIIAGFGALLLELKNIYKSN